MTEKEKSERLKKLLQKKASLDSEIARAKKAEAVAARKADSRRKIVLGGVILAAIREGKISETSVRALIDRFAADRDKTIFESWEFETAGTISAVPEAAAPVPEETASAE